jgi:hypothetical protein
METATVPMHLALAEERRALAAEKQTILDRLQEIDAEQRVVARMEARYGITWPKLQ